MKINKVSEDEEISLANLPEIHQEKMDQINRNTEVSIEKNEQYKCVKCGSKYNFETSLLKHYKLKHPDTQGTEYEKSDFITFHQRTSLIKHCERKNHRTEKSLRNGKNNYDKSQKNDIHKCEKCGSKYSLKKSLLRHYKLKHPDTLQEAESDKSDYPTLECSDCGLTFHLRTSLMKHCRRKNHRTPDKSVKNDAQKYICHQCNTSFNIKHNLVHHIKQYHILKKEYKADKFRCALCNFTFKKYSELLEHYTDHNIEIKREVLKFDSDTQFHEWKREEESKVCNSFIKHFASKTSKKGVRRETYYCHRSGTFKSKGKGQRKLKKQGSKKIGKNCPARMYVQVPHTGGVIVDYISTHVAHDIDLCHLTLTGTERLALATKISMKIPFDDILQEVRSSADPHQLRRCDLLTRKDLNNIEKCFNLTSCRTQLQQQQLDDLENWAEAAVAEDGTTSRTSDCCLNPAAEQSVPPATMQQATTMHAPQTESFVEAKIKLINDLAQLVNDHVNCPEELAMAQKFMEPLLSALLSVRNLSLSSPQTNLEHIKQQSSHVVVKNDDMQQPPTTNVICLSEGSIQIIHAAPTHHHILHTSEQIPATHHIIDVIPGSHMNNDNNNTANVIHHATTEATVQVQNITVVDHQQQQNDVITNGVVEQETLSLPLINLESIFHSINS